MSQFYKWIIRLTDDPEGFTMLTQDCDTQEKAEEAAREKFGDRVVSVNDR